MDVAEVGAGLDVADLEDRANFLVATNQRWLAIRLDFLGGIMVFIVSISVKRFKFIGT